MYITIRGNILTFGVVASCFLLQRINAFVATSSSTGTSSSSFTFMSKNNLHRSVTSKPSHSTKLFGYIAADSSDEVLEFKEGGVGFTEDNAILMFGKVDRKGSAIATDMKHYSQVSSLGDISKLSGVTVLCKGSGNELYENPGLGTEKKIILAPLEAVSKSLESMENSGEKSKKVSINFTGGEDLMVHEVLEGVQRLVSGMDISSSSVEFRSLCDSSFPSEKCSVVALSFAGGSDTTEDIYWHEDQWWTLSEENLTVLDE
mmetsp:Transcript_16629/g.20322  ORF Transcript_16629/g.20322 Transcript_16629/m.20322 type:complete len:260 (+) Transcript_16629:281-1060(+)